MATGREKYDPNKYKDHGAIGFRPPRCIRIVNLIAFMIEAGGATRDEMVEEGRRLAMSKVFVYNVWEMLPMFKRAAVVDGKIYYTDPMPVPEVMEIPDGHPVLDRIKAAKEGYKPGNAPEPAEKPAAEKPAAEKAKPKGRPTKSKAKAKAKAKPAGKKALSDEDRKSFEDFHKSLNETLGVDVHVGTAGIEWESGATVEEAAKRLRKNLDTGDESDSNDDIVLETEADAVINEYVEKMKGKSITQLRKAAKGRISGYSRMKKDDLLKALAKEEVQAAV